MLDLWGEPVPVHLDKKSFVKKLMAELEYEQFGEGIHEFDSFTAILDAWGDSRGYGDETFELIELSMKDDKTGERSLTFMRDLFSAMDRVIDNVFKDS